MSIYKHHNMIHTHIIVLYACSSFVIHKPLSGFVIRNCIQYNYLVYVKDSCATKHKMVITVYYTIKREYYLILLSKANTFLQFSCHISPNCITTVFLTSKRITQGDTISLGYRGIIEDYQCLQI